jgi:hypothetical protein
MAYLASPLPYVPLRLGSGGISPIATSTEDAQLCKANQVYPRT